jgi:hypothetical protein
MAAAIWSGCAGVPIVAIESCALSMAHATLGAAVVQIFVTTAPGSTAFDRIPRGP